MGFYSRFLLDHFHCHDCCDCLLLCRSCDGQQPLEDLPPCWGSGHTRCRSSLHVHARVLGLCWQEPNRVQVHRLEHHCPSADDRVQPHPASRESTDRPRWLLEALGWLKIKAVFDTVPSVQGLNLDWFGTMNVADAVQSYKAFLETATAVKAR